MTWDTIVQIILFGIALSMDAFAVSITDGLIYEDINKKKGLFIATTFGVMQALMPLIGYWLIEIITVVVGASGGEQAGKVMGTIVTWLAFGLLILIGGKMLFEGIKNIKNKTEEKKTKKFSIKEVLFMGVVTAIDALAVGVSLHTGLSNNATIWLHVSIILVITFVISILGVFAGHFFEKLLKGRYEITSIIGGSILILLAIWIVISHYIGL